MKKKLTLTERFYAQEELTKEERELIGAGDIRINSAKCKLCGDIITSKHRHDFVNCKCGEIFVDGGSWYAKRGAKNFDNCINLIVPYKDI